MTSFPFDLTTMYRSRRLFIEEGQKRGYVFTRLDEKKHIYRIEKNGVGMVMQSLPSNLTIKKQFPDIEKKEVEKEMMEDCDMRVPKTYLVVEKDATTWTLPDDIKYPVVVKPSSGSLGKGVVVDVMDAEETNECVREIVSAGKRALVEEMITIPDARECRIVVLDGKTIACVERRPASVIGDGAHSIAELIAHRNEEPGRGAVESREHTLHYISAEDAVDFLAKKNLSLDTVPDAKERVFLSNKVTSIYGADLIDRTSDLHDDFKKMCEVFVKKFNLLIIGFDIIAQDIAQPAAEQTYFFNEINVRPFFDINQYTNFGPGVNVSGLLWDFLEENSGHFFTTDFLEY